MKTVSASHARTQFSAFLDRVERGEEVVITRCGKEIARLTPVRQGRDIARAQAAIDGPRKVGEEIKRTHGPITLEEIKSWRDEGRR